MPCKKSLKATWRSNVSAVTAVHAARVATMAAAITTVAHAARVVMVRVAKAIAVHAVRAATRLLPHSKRLSQQRNKKTNDTAAC